MPENEPSFIRRTLRSPFSLFGGIILGLVTGVYFPDFGVSVGPFGDVFLNIMKMCIIPIIITSISLSISELLRSKTGYSMTRIISTIFLVALISSSIGVSVSYFSEPGKGLDPTSSATLKEVVDSASRVERALDEPIEPRTQKNFLHIVLNAFPNNIFESLSENKTFQIVIFSIIFGIAVAFILESYQKVIRPLLEATMDVFQKIFEGITLGLPIAVFCLMARDATEIGVDTLVGMASFVWKFYIAFFILFTLASIVIMRRTRTGLGESFSTLKVPLTIALATQSSVAAIPAAIRALREGFRLNKQLTNMLVPLGTVVGRYGNGLYFGFATLFVTQLYGVDLSIGDLAFVTIMCLLAGVSTAGATGVLTLGLLIIVLEPLGLPISAVLVLFIAVDPIIDPARTLLNVYTNCAVVSMVAPKPDKV